MKLGLIVPANTANANYRAIFPMQALERSGHDVVWPQDISRQAELRQLMSCDLVHCYRSWDRLADLDALSSRGVAVSFDNDDNLRASDNVAGKSSLRGHKENRQWWATYERMARLADVVTTPSEDLATRYRKAGAKEVVVIENYLTPAMACFGHRSAHDGVVVGWVAAGEHAKDVPALRLAETFSRLLDAHSDVRVLTVGVRLPLGSPRYEYIEKVPHNDLLKVVSRMDIGIAPLLDSEFNRSRSAVKLKEYAACGVVWAASPVGPYRGLGGEQGGVLVADDAWFETLDRLVRGRIARFRVGRRAMRWGRTQTIDRHVGEWEASFQLAIDQARLRMKGRIAHARSGSLERRRKTRR
jgi:hypothetical protein